jgi:hypothetical protein
MKSKAAAPQCELFGARLSELLNPEHPLYVLAERIDWSQFDAAIDACCCDKLGRPVVNTRLMVGLLYWKHAYDESEESVVARWVENPYWQFFCGCQYMQHDLPIERSSLSKWRKRVGAERLEKLLEATLHTALAMKAVRPQEFQHRTSRALDGPYAQRCHGRPRLSRPRLRRLGGNPRGADDPKQATRALKRMLRRRAAIEPTIGHLKSDNRMNRNYLTGREGDKLNAALSAAGYNLRKLLR